MLLGDSRVWLSAFQNYEQQAIDCITTAWPQVLEGINSTSIENEITRTLCFWLRKDRRLRDIGVLIPFHYLLELNANKIADAPSEIDFSIQIGDDPDHYLAFECKRINVEFPSGKKSLIYEYIEEGLMRFITLKYAPKVPLACMLGYVSDGDLISASTKLEKGLLKHSTKTKQNGALTSLSNSSSLSTTCCSHHQRNDGRFIEIRHTLLGIS